MCVSIIINDIFLCKYGVYFYFTYGYTQTMKIKIFTCLIFLLKIIFRTFLLFMLSRIITLMCMYYFLILLKSKQRNLIIIILIHVYT